MTDRHAAIRALYRRRPRDRFARATLLALGALVVISWVAGSFRPADLFSERRLRNLERGVARFVPVELRHEDTGPGDVLAWVGDVLEAKGLSALGTTLAISIAAIVLAGLLGALLAGPATRTLASPEPYVPGGRPPSRWARGGFALLAHGTRGLLIFLRAVPEYVWAFLLLAILGPTVWAAVFALALHNAGILGRLGADTLENARPRPLGTLASLGASRAQIAAVGGLPAVLPRWLLYFFYRWETCVREATVLGLLGIVSLGYYIQFDARPRRHYGEMLLLILLGSALVLLGDLVSAVARRIVRRAS